MAAPFDWYPRILIGLVPVQVIDRFDRAQPVSSHWLAAWLTALMLVYQRVFAVNVGGRSELTMIPVPGSVAVPPIVNAVLDVHRAPPLPLLWLNVLLASAPWAQLSDVWEP